jgi:putative flippase GtrA
MTVTTEPLPSKSPVKQYASKEGKRFARFLVVGAIGFVLDFGISNLAHALGFGAWVGHSVMPAISKSMASFLVQNPEVAEQTLSLSVAITSNFIWNYFWIYPEARGAKQGGKMVKFLIVSLAGLAIGVPLTAVLVVFYRGALATLHIAGDGLNLAGNLAQVTRVGLLLFWNFFVNRYWTYKDVQ